MKTVQLILASKAGANLSRVKAEMILGQVETEVITSQAEAKVNPCQILNQSKIEVSYPVTDKDMIDQPSDEVNQRGQPTEALESIPLISEEKRINIGTKPRVEKRTRLIKFLRTNANVFAWSHKGMSGIDPNVIVHQLMLTTILNP